MALSVTLKNVKLEEKRGSYEWRTFEPRRTNMWDQNLADLGFETGKNRLIRNIPLIVNRFYTLSDQILYRHIICNIYIHLNSVLQLLKSSEDLHNFCSEANLTKTRQLHFWTDTHFTCGSDVVERLHCCN